MKAEELKELARRCGAELTGVAPAERWAAWPAGRNPRSIQPRCRAVIVVGRRILRGAFRGVEEGTSFSNTYGMYGADWHENAFLTRVVHELARAIEAGGAEAVPLQGDQAGDGRPAAGAVGGEAGVKLDCLELARLAGLGTIGKGGFFLTAAYGHRQRFGLILTEMELAGDPVAEPDFCQGCDACLRACPLQALKEAGEGRFALDERRCALCANGRFTLHGSAGPRTDRLAAACGRACLVALENKIANRFRAPFRRRSVWTRDIHGKVSLHPPAGQEASA